MEKPHRLPGDHKMPRRPMLAKFDSLQELLEEAGYKETRIITPAGQAFIDSATERQCAGTIPVSSASSSSSSSSSFSSTPSLVKAGGPPSLEDSSSGKERATARSEHAPATEQSDNTESIIRRFQNMAANSSWFSQVWKAQPTHTTQEIASKRTPSQGTTILDQGAESARARLLRKKKSAPSMQALDRHSATAKIDGYSRADTPKKGAAVRKSKPTLRHAPSTQNIWQGSLRHRNAVTLRDKDGKMTSLPKSNSFPSRLRLDEGDSVAAQAKKDAIDGARVVTAVGFARHHSTSKDSIRSRLVLHGRLGELSDAEIANSMTSLKSHKKRPSLVDVFGPKGQEEDDDVGDAPNALPTASDERAIGLSEESSEQHKPDFSTGEARRDESQALVDTAEEKAYIAETLLFSQAAEPIISYDDAVALRNGGCLEEVGRSSSVMSSVTTEAASAAGASGSRASKNGLRKMKSVDALEKALYKMEQSAPGLAKGRRPSETSSSAAMTWGSWRFAGSRRQANPSMEQVLFEDNQQATGIEPVGDIERISEFGAPQKLDAEEYSTIEVPEVEVPRPTTPTLFVTSPTATRSPVELSLDGEEFEARSYSSPEHTIGGTRGRGKSRIPRPRRGRMTFETKAEQSSPTLVRPAAVSTSSPGRTRNSARHPLRRKARLSNSSSSTDGSAEQNTHDTVNTAGLTSSSKRRPGGVRNNKYPSAAQISSAVGKVSGSEQIRALRRDVLKREGATAASVDSDPDDVFYDLTSAAMASKNSNSVLDFNRKTMGEEIDRRRSPNPFEKAPKGPLADASQSKILNSNNTNHHPLSDRVVGRSAGPTLHRKRSGVGMACLFDTDSSANSSSKSRTSSASRSSTPVSDENVAPSDALLDSPTVQVKGKRRGTSRATLEERRKAKNDAADML